ARRRAGRPRRARRAPRRASTRVAAPRRSSRSDGSGAYDRPRMIDLRRLRDDAEYRRGIERKRLRDGLLDEVLRLDAEEGTLANEAHELRARQNAASREISRAGADERAAKVATAKQLKDELSARETELATLDASVRALAFQVPNAADPSVPDGGEDDGEV